MAARSDLDGRERGEALSAPTGAPRRASGLRALVVVPARLGSTRLPRKMLLSDSGRYLFEHATRRALASSAAERVVLATDSEEILAAAAGVGLEAMLTDAAHRSGTDRVNEVVRRLAGQDPAGSPWDVVVNVQGDEAEFPTEDLATLLGAFADPEVEFATLAAPLRSLQEWTDPNVVKVVCDERGNALYFTRAPVGCRPEHGTLDALRHVRHHVGVYAYRPATLARFCALAPGQLELGESLEQLRWLEAGGRIRVEAASRAGGGVDTAEDYRAFVERTRDQENHAGLETS